MTAPDGVRRMRMTPLQARQAGSLKGYGFTITFEDPHSSKLISSPALTDSPTLTPLAASGSQFHERCTCGATCQDIGGGRCRYEAGDA